MNRIDPRWLAWLILATAGSVFCLGAVARLSGFEVWDDGLMFSRYAENVAREGVVAWNPATELGEAQPSWGLTSLGHLVVVVVARTVLRPIGGDALSWAVVSSWLAGWVFLGLVLRAAWSHDPRSSVGAKLGTLTWTAAVLAMGFRSVGAHFGTGMDTMTAAAWLTFFLMMARRLECLSGRKLVVLTAATASLTFFVRPDAAVFPVFVLAALAVGVRGSRRAWEALGGAAALGGVLWLSARAYFGTWLPLPSYVKSGGVGGTGHYGDAFAIHYEGVAVRELGLFALAFWPLILVVALDVLSSPRRWWRQSQLTDKGLAAAVVVFSAYHLTQVAPIMGGDQRFFQPLLPCLLWLSWGSMNRWRDRLAARGVGPRGGRWHAGWATGLALAAVLGLLSLGSALLEEGQRLGSTLDREPWPTLDLQVSYEQRASGYWPALEVVGRLPPETVIAATEVGLPGALNPRKTIVDMAGLHDPRFALEGFSAERLFAGSDGPGTDVAPPPDVIYLPHPHYQPMLQELLRHPTLQARYRLWTAEALGTVLGVAVRRGSAAEEPLAEALASVTAARSRQ